MSEANGGGVSCLLTQLQHFFNAILRRIVYNRSHKVVGGRQGRRVNKSNGPYPK
jgi:hypothetical protein